MSLFRLRSRGNGRLLDQINKADPRMEKIMKVKIAVAALLSLAATFAFAHGGGLNKEGCHMNHKTGEYHCH